MNKDHGKFVWYDVMTSDTKAAESFYRSVIGWDANDSGMTDRSYTLLSVGPVMVGGLMPIPEDARAAGARPCWMGYIGVEDVDAYAARVKAAGGSVRRAPEDIPGVGRFAVVADPHGAGFMLFQAASDQELAQASVRVPDLQNRKAGSRVGARRDRVGDRRARQSARRHVPTNEVHDLVFAVSS